MLPIWSLIRFNLISPDLSSPFLCELIQRHVDHAIIKPSLALRCQTTHPSRHIKLLVTSEHDVDEVGACERYRISPTVDMKYDFFACPQASAYVDIRSSMTKLAGTMDFPTNISSLSLGL